MHPGALGGVADGLPLPGRDGVGLDRLRRDHRALGIDEALAAGVISEIVDRPDSYRFVHDVVRQALDGDLGSARRVRAHLRIAQALEEQYGTDPSRAPEIALHYCSGIAAGSAERAASSHGPPGSPP